MLTLVVMYGEAIWLAFLLKVNKQHCIRLEILVILIVGLGIMIGKRLKYMSGLMEVQLPM